MHARKSSSAQTADNVIWDTLVLQQTEYLPRYGYGMFDAPLVVRFLFFGDRHRFIKASFEKKLTIGTKITGQGLNL